jgi:hypothetical protein
MRPRVFEENVAQGLWPLWCGLTNPTEATEMAASGPLDDPAVPLIRLDRHSEA